MFPLQFSFQPAQKHCCIQPGEVVFQLTPDCIQTQILGTAGEVLDTALWWLSHPCEWELVSLGVESGDSRQGRLVRSAKNQFIRGVEVDLVGGFLANVRILY